MLESMLKNVKFDGVDINNLAYSTPGYVAADLDLLIKFAGVNAY